MCVNGGVRVSAGATGRQESVSESLDLVLEVV